MTSFAKFTRFFSPYLFRATRWTADWGFYGFEKLIQFLAWSLMWLGMVAAVVWILGGVGLGVAWIAIKMKPTWRKSLEQRPVLTKFVARVVVETMLWRITRRWIAVWIGKVVLVVAVGFEGYKLLQIATSQTTNPTLPRPVHSTSDKEADDDNDETAEQWARKVREEMLRDSLLRRGRTTGKETDSRTESSVAEEDS